LRYCLKVVWLLGVAVVPLLASTADTQAQTKIRRVGILTRPVMSGAANDQWYEQVVRALGQHGWREGKNVSLVYRTASGDPPQYDASAAELVTLQVDVIYASNAPAVRAAYKATRTIPIVGQDYTNDPVATGYAQSYAHPGRNITGFFLDAPEFAGKWLEQLKALVPGLARVAALWDPAPGSTHLKAVQNAARNLGIQLQILEIHAPGEIKPALAKMHGGTQALLILPSPMTWAQSVRLAELAMKYRLPATSMADAFAEAGGLLSYGPDDVEGMERCVSLVSRVLGGAKPGDLPIARSTRLPLIINIKTADALGLTVPDSVLLGANRVIR